METMKAGRMVEVGRMECEEIPVPSLNEASLSDAPSTVPDAAFGSTSPDFDVLIALGDGVDLRQRPAHGDDGSGPRSPSALPARLSGP